MKIIINGNDLAALNTKMSEKMLHRQKINDSEHRALRIINITSMMDVKGMYWGDCDYVINKIGDELQVLLYWGDILLREYHPLTSMIMCFFESPRRKLTEEAFRTIIDSVNYYMSTPINEIVVPVRSEP
jgi:hypothetical protein